MRAAGEHIIAVNSLRVFRHCIFFSIFCHACIINNGVRAEGEYIAENRSFAYARNTQRLLTTIIVCVYALCDL